MLTRCVYLRLVKVCSCYSTEVIINFLLICVSLPKILAHTCKVLSNIDVIIFA